MKQRALTISIGVAGVVLATCLATGMLAWAQAKPAGSAASLASGPGQLAASPQPGPSAPGTTVAWAKALGLARSGAFDKAIGQLEQYLKATPQDGSAKKALDLLQDYQTRQVPIEADRVAELAESARRVRQSMLAQEYQPKLVDAKVADKLRQQIQDAISPYNDAGNADGLEECDAKAAKDLQKQTVGVYGKSRSAVQAALKTLPADKSEFTDTFRKQTETYLKLLAVQEEIWSSAEASTPKARRAAAKRLRAAEDDLSGALGDLEALATKKPWRIGLMYARLARQVALPADKLDDQEWYRKFVTWIEDRGKKAVAEAGWYDALAIYGGLNELDHDNTYYQQMVKTVRRHVRILGLYGQDTKADSDNGNGKNKPATKPAEDDEPTWKEVVSGVDMDMIEKAIEQLDAYYVSSVDYRKVTVGGLKSIKVLAETPQASYTFPALADKAKKDAFVKAVDRQMETVQKRDRVDHLDLQLALNSILRASEQSVQIPTEVLAVEFTDGFLDELDKFSAMIWPNEVDDFRKQTMGQFYGVGIQITKEPGEPLKVVTPLAGSPAFRAGIKTNDLIIAVDGKGTEGLSIDKLVRRITGPKGTKVVLRIKRVGLVTPINVPITRDEIRIRTVKGWRRSPDGEWDYVLDPQHHIGYIRITQFTDQTAEHMAQVLTDFQKAGIRSVIVDLRFNPGGLLRAATKVADEFLDSGRIVSTRGLQTRQTEVNARSAGLYLTGDVVFLANRHSASAAEIVAGAIKDRQRGLIVGERTFGKGSVQNVIPIRKHRAYLKLTTAYYYLPLGRCLHRIDGATAWGVDPDVDAPITPRQTKRWLDVRRKTDLIQEIDPQDLTEDLDAQYKADIQLNAAVLLLRLLQLDHAQQIVKPAA